MRAATFYHQNGNEASVGHLGDILAKHIRLICNLIIKTGAIYTSVGFKVAIDVAALVPLKAVLLDFVALDNRGGIFAQSHMRAAIKQAIDNSDLCAKFEQVW